MTKSEFLTALGETLMSEEPLTMETELNTLEGWDSMGRVQVVSLIDESLGTTLARGSLQKCTRVADIITLVISHLSEQ